MHQQGYTASSENTLFLDHKHLFAKSFALKYIPLQENAKNPAFFIRFYRFPLAFCRKLCYYEPICFEKMARMILKICFTSQGKENRIGKNRKGLL